MYNKANLRILRRYLDLTQKEFIQRFLYEELQETGISISTYSNLEAKGGNRLGEVILTVSMKLQVDAMIFTLDTEAFIEKINVLLPNQQKEYVEAIPTKQSSVSQLLHRLTLYFSEKMFNKTLKKGDKIESDRELAMKLNVGRSAIREALKVLDVLGMIDIKPGQGSYICSDESEFFIIPFSWSLFLNGNQVNDIVETRNLIQVSAARLAAKNKDETFLGELNEITRKMHLAYTKQNHQEFLESDVEFHLCIAKGSNNSVYYSMSQTISSLMKHVSETGMVDQNQLKEIYEEHNKVYGLILVGDCENAALAMQHHLEKSKARYNYN